jgi:hypothetical protein
METHTVAMETRLHRNTSFLTVYILKNVKLEIVTDVLDCKADQCINDNNNRLETWGVKITIKRYAKTPTPHC